MQEYWALDPSVIYLNHGTVGAPPRCVLEAQQKLRDEIERQPSHFLLRELAGIRLGAGGGSPPRLRAAADKVAHFLGAEGKDLVFVDNATTGINAVLRSFGFREGDEILVFDHAYGAIRNAIESAAKIRGASVKVVEFPEALSKETLIESVQRSIGPRTRLAVFDHITADSALVLPLREIAEACRRHGIAVLADGAHAPGAVAVNIPELGVDWYTGNLHKWAWSPRSSGLLWTASERQAELHNPVVSWGVNQGMTQEFDWPGTRDPTPHLAAPAGIEFMEKLGVEGVQRYNHDLACTAGREMALHWKTQLLGPESMIGTMVTVPLPERYGSTRDEAIRLRDALLFHRGIEVHLSAWKNRVRVRVSAQIYNEMSDIEKLIDAIDRWN